MKKYYFILLCSLLVIFIPNVSASSVCKEPDTTKWKYVETTIESRNQAFTSDEKLIVCCKESATSTSFSCDHYEKKVIGSGGLVTADGPRCNKADETMWNYIKTTREMKNITSMTERTATYCCQDNTFNFSSYNCDYYELKGGTPSVKPPENPGSSGSSNPSVEEKPSGDNPNVQVNYCQGLSTTFIFIGHLIRLAKILIPIVIIGFGIMDFFKAMTGAKDDEIKKSLRSLVFRLISGVCIFFLPMFINLIFSFVSGWSESYEATYQDCFKCIWDVGSCTK